MHPLLTESKKAGRPRALDEIKRGEICALVHMGSSLEGAARYVGCATSTIRREARRNPEFGQSLRRSSYSAEIAPLQAMREFAKNHWRAAAWLLERLDPERFAKPNLRFLKPKDLQNYSEMLAELLKDEIRDPADLERVHKKLNELAKVVAREAWANRDTAPRPRHGSPNRPRTRFEYPPGHPSAARYNYSDADPTSDHDDLPHAAADQNLNQ
jgi:hypothetical protein